MTAVWQLPQIKEALSSIDTIAAMERAFQAYSEGRAIVPPVGELLFENPPGDAHIKYGYIRGDDAFVIKIATGFYDNPKKSLPPNSGILVVFSAANGFPSAVLLDEGYLTNARTAAAGAVAAKYLAPAKINCIGICGTGMQARLQLQYLKPVTACRNVMVWGRSSESRERYAREMEAEGFNVQCVASPRTMGKSCELIVTATLASSPYIEGLYIQPGTHVTAMGSDTPTKNELRPDVLGMADVVVADSRAQCAERGEIHHALAANEIEVGDVVELGEIIGGTAPGRSSGEQVTVCDLTGVAVQDIEISKAVLAHLQR